MLRFIVAFQFCAVMCARADTYPRQPFMDVLHYTFQLEVNDATDVVYGEATITINLKESRASLAFDLVKQKRNGRGMQVTTVLLDGAPVTFAHENDRVILSPGKDLSVGEHEVRIAYSGIPDDGLIIGKNKFGERTFFGDNWPDRGHHWLACVDHPYDKAPVDFVIIAPERYQVVATGVQVEESNLSQGRKLTHWREHAPVPVKVMTVGIGRFAVKLSAEVGNVPVTTWVYPQNRDDGFSDFAVAPKVLNVLQQYIGTYPYEKLAHVQSKTRFGGLENASNIFYFENSVDGKNEREDLIAHETAHQWFGNSASEDDWNHVWLSEGFATYMTIVYLEKVYGEGRKVAALQTDRVQVVEYLRKSKRPIVDTTLVKPDDVLSTNTYQKASWVLHMLRNQLGDSAFHKSVQAYYQKFKGSNALTRDFQQVCEEISGQPLQWFFTQWLFRAGHPSISAEWSYNAKKRQLTVDLVQEQQGEPFQFELELAAIDADGRRQILAVPVNSRKVQWHTSLPFVPATVTLDPHTRLLFEGQIKRK